MALATDNINGLSSNKMICERLSEETQVHAVLAIHFIKGII